jgi:hypothetical protein
MMAWPTILCGAFLVADGVVGYLHQQSENPSPTALIPAAFGGVLMVCGLLAFKDSLRKHVMHLAVIVGLVGAIGGVVNLIRLYSKSGSLDLTSPKALSSGVMLLVCAFFVVLCVKSFIDVRKARQASGSH